jgi:hypothetical protein
MGPKGIPPRVQGPDPGSQDIPLFWAKIPVNRLENRGCTNPYFRGRGPYSGPPRMGLYLAHTYYSPVVFGLNTGPGNSPILGPTPGFRGI